MNKLEILENEIRKDLPRLLKPTEGCWLFMKGYENIKLKIIHRRAKEFIVDDYRGHKPIDYRNSVFEDYFEIIGHDILLSDVLEWLNTKKMVNILCKEVTYTGYGVFVSLIQNGYLDISYLYNEYKISPTSRLGKWNLSKPYLKDQSEELIKRLYNLIKK